MAGLFDYEDPRAAGNLAFAGGLLNAGGPQRMPVSLGQALAQAFAQRQGMSSNVADEVAKRQLMGAQIQKMQADAEYRKYMASKGMTPDMPAAIQVYEYIQRLGPEQQRAFYASQRGVQGREINGIWHEWRGPAIGYVPTTTLENEGAAQGYLSGIKTYAQEQEKARFAPYEGVDQNKQPVLSSQLQQMMARGLLGGGPVPPQVQRQPAPPLQKSPIGFPSGYMNPEEQKKAWGQYQSSGTAYPGDAMQPVPTQVAQAQPQMPQGAILPKAAGEAARAGEKEAAVKDVQYQAKLRENYPKAKAAISSLENNTKEGLALIADLENSKGEWWNTGYISNIPTRWVKGSAAFIDESKMDVLRNKVVLETIANLKTLSATGSTGFGNLTEKEGSRLENAKATLQTGLDPAERRKALGILKESLLNIQKVSKEEFDTEYGQFQTEELRKKYGLK